MRAPKVLENAAAFIYRNARPLDLARWQYHFENGSKEAVLRALAYYQNEDGGFGHALEADAWNPESAPIQTWAATEILREICFTDATHPIVQGILRYLASGRDYDGTCWFKMLKSNNDYPHAPWWQTDANSTDDHDYNPTASLAGFILYFADKSSDLYAIGCNIAQEAFNKLMFGEKERKMHTLSCYVQMAEYIELAGVDVIDLAAFKAKLRELVKECIEQDTSVWATSYICKPSQFFRTKDSVFYSDNRATADYEAEFIVQTQLDDGTWNITWDWGIYPNEWALSKNWWKANVVILNLLYLREFGDKISVCL